MDQTEPPQRRAKSPSQSRKEAVDSVVYRLSELMFGSLLAAYVLGFIGFAAAGPTRTTAFQGNLSAFYPEGLTYLCISTTFAYLTSALYISYHVSILTMPHLPLSRLRWDFLVALLQAVLFGLSMLSPVWFPFCTGCVLLAGITRQFWEHRALADWFCRDVFSSNPASPITAARENQRQRQELRRFRRSFAAELKQIDDLSIWQSVPKSTVGAVVLLIGGGLFVYLRRRWSVEPKIEALMGQITAWVALVVFLFFLFRVNSLLKERAGFLYSGEAIESLDREFNRFYDLLAQRANDRVRKN